ncbi:hypothetical protein [Caulobacter sp.]|uniref:hypothetical protein n=1 Tax=Caulobacter sp. TaxID=78 RepID=UPI003BB047B3
MPAVRTTFRSQNHRGRSCRDFPALTVTFNVLQLMTIAFVWLLALVPLTLMALGATMLRAVRPAAAPPGAG